jgi:hypothetical protein
LQEYPRLAGLIRAQHAGGRALAQRRRSHVQELRGFVQAYCPISNDHDQPLWLRPFRDELSRAENYYRELQWVQREFRGNSGETRKGVSKVGRAGQYRGPIVPTDTVFDESGDKCSIASGSIAGMARAVGQTCLYIILRSV